MDTKKIAANGKIFECVTGSNAYGMATPESDYDTRGIFIAPPENVITGIFPIDQWQDPDNDRVLYELRKFLKLIADQNPNILELLWVDEKHILDSKPAYDYIRSRRGELLSSKAKHTFSGYAFAQLKRLRNHNKWVNNPQSTTMPEMKDFANVATGQLDLNDRSDKVFKSITGSTFAVVKQKGGKLFTDKGEFNPSSNELNEDIDDVIAIVSFDRSNYDSAINQWKGYWEWRSKRNPKRLDTEDTFGYDTKHAAHLIRLMRMGNEILEEGKVIVERPDAEELLDIRRGKYSLEEIEELAKDLEDSLNGKYETTTLQKRVDNKVVSKIIYDAYMEQWGLCK